jgi:hypothetical protein
MSLWVIREGSLAANPHPSPRSPESRPAFNAVTSRTWFSSSATEEYVHAGSSEYVWPTRTKLQIEGRARGLAMFNLAIGSKLRSCGVAVSHRLA